MLKKLVGKRPKHASGGAGGADEEAAPPAAQERQVSEPVAARKAGKAEKKPSKSKGKGKGKGKRGGHAPPEAAEERTGVVEEEVVEVSDTWKEMGLDERLLSGLAKVRARASGARVALTLCVCSAGSCTPRPSSTRRWCVRCATGRM